MAACVICSSPIEPFLSFGKMPIANGFVRESEFEQEYFFELGVAFCGRCSMVQLATHVQRERMFHDSYAFFSSTSARMAAHFACFSDEVRKGYLDSRDPFVVEIGSNDG